MPSRPVKERASGRSGHCLQNCGAGVPDATPFQNSAQVSKSPPPRSPTLRPGLRPEGVAPPGRRGRQQARVDSQPEAGEPTEEPGWREQLPEQMLGMQPGGFERLAQRLLREADFDSVNVTGKSGDGRIDRFWCLQTWPGQLPGLLPVQAIPRQRWRWRGPRLPWGDGWPWGQGTADHNRIVTTEAKKEATRDGAPPVDLIDGDLPCELLKRYELGVKIAVRPVEDVSIELSSFDET